MSTHTSNEINDTCDVHDHLMPDGRCSCPTKLGVNRQQNSKIEVCRAAFEKHLGSGAQLNRGRGGYYVAAIVERSWQDFSTGWCARDAHETSAFVGIDFATGADRTVWSCPDCGITSYPCNHVKDMWERERNAQKARDQQ